MFLKLVAKDRLRSWTTITWALPLTIFASYGLYERLILGKERKPTPAIWAPFTPVENPDPVREPVAIKMPEHYVSPVRPFEEPIHKQ
ncbi:hypothetical protein BC830DRAFT_1120959 [Chytriomyces sp. MP71]|nr:hypothetical protein BC830DRAFT_1120959 [Chytriomyces sp. MP71]